MDALIDQSNRSPTAARHPRSFPNGTGSGAQASHPATAWGLLIAFGLYLSLNGYRSFEGDQAYRLPLLVDRQDATIYAADPFVRAFDAFNPHSGYLTLLDLTSRVIGLSGALLFWFSLTFLTTAWAIARLGRLAWGAEVGDHAAGWVAVALALATRAGNIGTNHLFEPMLLDRLMALALGWVAVGEIVSGTRRAWWSVGLLVLGAQAIHPSLGLQLGLWLAAGWLILGLIGGLRDWGIRPAYSVTGIVAIVLVLLPAILRIPAQSKVLLEGLPSADFYALAALVQGPQHMVPHLWRGTQWAAWLCLMVLGVAIAMRGDGSRSGSRSSVDKSQSVRARLAVLLGLVLVALAFSWVAIEGLRDVKLTLFQPFRMATVARGLALVMLAGRVLSLWRRDGWIGPARAGLLCAGVTGDWAMIAATSVELATTLAGHVERRLAWRNLSGGLWLISLIAACLYLKDHDTQDGPFALIAGGLAGPATAWLRRRLNGLSWSRIRVLRLAVYAWAVPIAAFVVGWSGWGVESPVGGWLTTHLRFTELPRADDERLGDWCRKNLPADARLIGPPGPKGLRLWARRPLMFNRASSPYHAAGLADWARRYCDHVGLAESSTLLAEAYLADRHRLEARYDALDVDALAALARRQGADHIVASSDLPKSPDSPALNLLHVEGTLAVYRVNAPAIR